MKFEELNIGEALGSILVRSFRKDGVYIQKGGVLTESDLYAIGAHQDTVAVVRLGERDESEDDAANRIGLSLLGEGAYIADVSKGRANLCASVDGLVKIDEELIRKLNGVNESVTVATMPVNAVIREGQVICSVKIITYGVSAILMESCLALLAEPAVGVEPFEPRTIGLIQTCVEGINKKMLDKTVKVLRERIEALGGELLHELRCEHRVDSLVEAISQIGEPDITLITGATAIADRNDVIPAAICEAGGEIEHFGMPVYPGNLLMLARLKGKPAVGVPGCARSRANNGFDWVLQRLFSRSGFDKQEIMNMGVGGLLIKQ